MTDMPYMVLLAGPAGCGKSTVARELGNRLGYAVVSSDAIRKEIYGDEEDQTDPSRVFGIAHNRALQLLQYGYSVVFDATNCRKWHREAVLRTLEDVECCKICAVSKLPLEECLARNQARDRRVPEAVISRMIRDLEAEPPSVDEGYYMVCDMDDVVDIMIFLGLKSENVELAML